MKLVGCLLLVSGWLIVLCALGMLTGLHQRMMFVFAGMAVECLGLVLWMQAYKSMQRKKT